MAKTNTKLPPTIEAYVLKVWSRDVAALPWGSRIAHFLDWAARSFPKVHYSASLISQAINGQHSTPAVNDPNVVAIPNYLRTAKDVSLREYKRAIIHERGVGWRATVDDNDAVQTDLPQVSRRIASAHANAKRHIEVIDSSNLSKKNAAAFAATSKAIGQIGDGITLLALPPRPPRTL